ncbi:hypothetical protein [Streptomyces sp. NPDC048295]|uniref:hypothetical protein n=1 Tax=Streptomyces sp. NPDC048295 TaxID=3154617 RepID=UPI0034493F0B
MSASPRPIPPDPALRVLYALLVLVYVIRLLIIGAAAVYLTWQHPALTAPINAGAVAITPVVTLTVALIRIFNRGSRPTATEPVPGSLRSRSPSTRPCAPILGRSWPRVCSAHPCGCDPHRR